MSQTDHSPFSREIAAVTAWWQEAGVDTCFEDEATVWLAEKEAEKKSQKGAPERRTNEAPSKDKPVTLFGGGLKSWPTELDEFQAWFAGDLSREIAGREGVGPKGQTGADLMVVVPHPDKADQEQLLSGETGDYLRAILTASNIDPEAVYLASVLPGAMPHPDWQELGTRGLGQILKNHIALAAPKRIVALGSSILPLIGNNPAQGPAEIQRFEQDSASTPLFAAWQIERLRQRSAARKRFWKTWLDWIASDD